MTGIGKTMLTGLFSMVVFFFIFLIIFPDNVKLAKKARGKYERARVRGASADKLATMSEKALAFEKRARISESDKTLYIAASEASAAAMRYFVLKPDKNETEAAFSERKRAAFKRACAAIDEKRRAEQAVNNDQEGRI